MNPADWTANLPRLGTLLSPLRPEEVAWNEAQGPLPTVDWARINPKKRPARKRKTEESPGE